MSQLRVNSITNTGGSIIPNIPGTIAQVVHYPYTPLVTTSSTSFVNFTSVNFTPKYATSKVAIIATFSTSNGGAIQVRRNSTNIFSPVNAFHVFTGTGGPDYGASTVRIPYSFNVVDSPATTSTITYNFDFRVYSGTFGINEGGSGVSSVILMEVAQ